MILKVNTAQRYDPPLWWFLGDVTGVVAIGEFEYNKALELVMADVCVGTAFEVAGPLPTGVPGEWANGWLHSVTFSNRPTALFWLNATDAFLLSEKGDTIDRLASGGGYLRHPLPA
jgi:hypothetical protein